MLERRLKSKEIFFLTGAKVSNGFALPDQRVAVNKAVISKVNVVKYFFASKQPYFAG